MGLLSVLARIRKSNHAQLDLYTVMHCQGIEKHIDENERRVQYKNYFNLRICYSFSTMTINVLLIFNIVMKELDIIVINQTR